ncbi:hypothetical protein COO60DRAFT_1104208 [Scenedesmus sp. NREL 46B-D3]|nr:hypothetical protein COO60DRAFT_1104208 [Scenedesmus sp. NREL 46B-D3]
MHQILQDLCNVTRSRATTTLSLQPCGYRAYVKAAFISTHAWCWGYWGSDLIQNVKSGPGEWLCTFCSTLQPLCSHSAATLHSLHPVDHSGSKNRHLSLAGSQQQQQPARQSTRLCSLCLLWQREFCAFFSFCTSTSMQVLQQLPKPWLPLLLDCPHFKQVVQQLAACAAFDFSAHTSCLCGKQLAVIVATCFPVPLSLSSLQISARCIPPSR